MIIMINSKGMIKGESPKPVCTSTTDDVIVPGFRLIENFITEEEEEMLLQSDMGREDSPQWMVSSIGRRQQHYGFKFNYYTRMIDFLNTVDNIPEYCTPFVSKLEDVINSTSNETNIDTTDNKVSTLFNQLTVNEYNPGHGIGNHIDTINCIGPVLCSLSLGSGCVMALTPIGSEESGSVAQNDTDILTEASDMEEVEGVIGSQLSTVSTGGSSSTSSSNGRTGKKYVYLPRRSMLILTGPARYNYNHGIAYRKSDMHHGELIPRHRRVSLTFRQVFLPGALPPAALSATAVERNHVFHVYDSIAVHWHHTRGKRKVFWAVVKDFLDALAPGSLVADVGCGDGKYFGVTNANNVVMIGCDRSIGLLKALKDSEQAANRRLAMANSSSSSATTTAASVAEVAAEDYVTAKKKNAEEEEEEEGEGKPTYNQTFCCDAVQVPMRSDAFDATLCIAVLHHLGSVDRRIAVIRDLVRITRPGGYVLIQAWAFEQEATSRHQFKPREEPLAEAEVEATDVAGVEMKADKKGKSSGGGSGSSAADQDVLVAWRLTKCWAQPTPPVANSAAGATADAVPATVCKSEGEGEDDSAVADVAVAGAAATPAITGTNINVYDLPPEERAAHYAAINAAKAARRTQKLSKKARQAAVLEVSVFH